MLVATWFDAISKFLIQGTGRPVNCRRIPPEVPPEVLLEKGVLKICSKFTEEHPCQSIISIKLKNSFIEVTFRHGYSPVNVLHIFKTFFLRTRWKSYFWSCTMSNDLRIRHLMIMWLMWYFLQRFIVFLVFQQSFSNDGIFVHVGFGINDLQWFCQTIAFLYCCPNLAGVQFL